MKNLLFVLSEVPYFGSIASLANSMFDICDIYEGLTQLNIYKSGIKIKTAAFRFVGNFLLGVTGFFPLLTIASCMLINPFIVPLVSFSVVLANLFKAFIIIKTIKYELMIDQMVFATESNKNSYTILKTTKKHLYNAQRDFVINSILTLGAVLSVVGVFCPPILVAGMGVGIIGGILGILDKKYYFIKKVLTLFEINENFNPPLINEKKNIAKYKSRMLEKKPVNYSYNTIFKKIKPLTCKSIYKVSSPVVPVNAVLNNSINNKCDNIKNPKDTYRRIM